MGRTYQQRPIMTTADIIIIGAGPGGMKAAQIARAQGLDTIIIERDLTGGTCLNRGCIPTKALLHSADMLDNCRRAATCGIDVSASFDFTAVAAHKKEIVDTLRTGAESSLTGCRMIHGEACFTAPRTVTVNGEEYSAERIIIATGSMPAALPIPGAEYTVDSDYVLAMDSLPESVCIIGGGVIGMEFARMFSAFGVDVTVLEYCSEILPSFDRTVAKRLRSILNADSHITIVTGAQVTSVSADRTVFYNVKGKEKSVTAALVVMAAGRRPVYPQGLDIAGIDTSPKGITTDSSFATTAEGIYAVGDVGAGMMLAHVAEAQASRVMGESVNLDIVPSVVFTKPELSMVGLTEEQCKTRGIDYTVGKSLWRANGKAVTMDETDGMIKVIAATDGTLLGVHILGPHASDLIQEAALAMRMPASIDLILSTIHPHPTLCEALKSAVAACRPI